jgi:cell division protein FtsZ
MQNSGVAIMGSAIAEGENRALDAIQQALNSPLLNNNDILGAKNILLNITSGIEEVTMDEVGVITDFVTSAVAKDSLMIWGTGMDLSLGNKICVTIIATGFEANSIPELYAHRSPTQRIHLSDENKGSTVIQVKPRETHILKDEKNVFQRTIEFEHIENQDFSDSFDITGEFEVKSSKSKGSKHTSDEKKNVPKTKDLSITNFNEHNLIEDLENQPAYIRKKINVSDVKTNKTNEISKYSLIEDEEKGVQIRPDNSYLHDNVD